VDREETVRAPSFEEKSFGLVSCFQTQEPSGRKICICPKFAISYVKFVDILRIKYSKV
jgi:hypothetical protein